MAYAAGGVDPGLLVWTSLLGCGGTSINGVIYSPDLMPTIRGLLIGENLLLHYSSLATVFLMPLWAFSSPLTTRKVTNAGSTGRFYAFVPLIGAFAARSWFANFSWTGNGQMGFDMFVQSMVTVKTLTDVFKE